MLEFPTWKRVWLWALTLVVAAAALPSLFSLANMPWPKSLPEPMVNLGLDLAGGSHILLEANPAQVRAQRLENMEESVRARLKNADPRIRIGDISSSGGKLAFTVRDTAQVDAAREEVLPLTYGAGLTGQRDWTIEVVDENRFVLTPTVLDKLRFVHHVARGAAAPLEGALEG